MRINLKILKHIGKLQHELIIEEELLEVKSAGSGRI